MWSFAAWIHARDREERRRDLFAAVRVETTQSQFSRLRPELEYVLDWGGESAQNRAFLAHVVLAGLLWIGTWGIWQVDVGPSASTRAAGQTAAAGTLLQFLLTLIVGGAALWASVYLRTLLKRYERANDLEERLRSDPTSLLRRP